MQLRRMFIVLSLCLLLSQHLITQTATQTPSATSAGQQSGATQSDPAKVKCTNNGTYVNSRGQTVPRPENCSASPKGATAQCRDGTYSVSLKDRSISVARPVASWERFGLR